MTIFILDINIKEGGKILMEKLLVYKVVDLKETIGSLGNKCNNCDKPK